MQYSFDTHAFIKAFVGAKSEEEKAEILARTIVETRQDSSVTVEKKFDKAKDELATKLDLAEIKSDLLKWMFTMTITVAGVQLGFIIFILKFFFKGVGGV